MLSLGKASHRLLILHLHDPRVGRVEGLAEDGVYPRDLMRRLDQERPDIVACCEPRATLQAEAPAGLKRRGRHCVQRATPQSAPLASGGKRGLKSLPAVESPLASPARRQTIAAPRKAMICRTHCNKSNHRKKGSVREDLRRLPAHGLKTRFAPSRLCRVLFRECRQHPLDFSCS
jgi:hypothetical protein